MASTDFEIQPVQDQKTDEMETQSDEKDVQSQEEGVESPDEEMIPVKTTVQLDPNAPNQSGRFNKDLTVHMSLIDRGVRTKGVFKVYKGRPHKSGAYYEYQLVDSDGRLFKNGQRIREKDLKVESRRS